MTCFWRSGQPYSALCPPKNRQKREHRQSKQKKSPKICRRVFQDQARNWLMWGFFFVRDVSREISQLFEASLPWMPLSDLEKVSTWWIWTRISSDFMGDRISAVESNGNFACLKKNLNLVVLTKVDMVIFVDVVPANRFSDKQSTRVTGEICVCIYKYMFFSLKFSKQHDSKSSSLGWKYSPYEILQSDILDLGWFREWHETRGPQDRRHWSSSQSYSLRLELVTINDLK